MTVQPEADQPKAETVADLVGHRLIEYRGLNEKRNKEIYFTGKSLPLAICLPMGA
jgi:hypothetical protein